MLQAYIDMQRVIDLEPRGWNRDHDRYLPRHRGSIGGLTLQGDLQDLGADARHLWVMTRKNQLAQRQSSEAEKVIHA